MSRARHVTPRQTAVRVERLRTLVSALLTGEMDRDEIGAMLTVGPSGVRKYLAELGSKIEIARYIDGTPSFIGFPVYRLAISANEARAYVDSLAVSAPARAAAQPLTTLSIATRDPSRHFHILQDDTNYAVRISRSPAMRDPMVAAFFGADRHEVRA